MNPEDLNDVDALLLEIAIAEREIEERKRYGEELPEEPDIDIELHDTVTVITRRRWDGEAA